MEQVLEKIKNDFQKETFEIKGVSFKVQKLSAWDGFPVVEKIRVALSKSAQSTAFEGNSSFLSALLAIPPEDLKDIRNDMFENVQFKLQKTDAWMNIAGAEDSAFGKLDVADVYEVVLRALAVNFSSTVLDVFRKSQNVLSILFPSEQ